MKRLDLTATKRIAGPLAVIWVILPVLIAAVPLHASTYYVASTGSDANSGQSAAAPWKTLKKVNATTFHPGDWILLHAGDSWTGQLAPRGSGTNGAPIRIDRYGGSLLPVVHGPGTDNSAAILLNDQQYWEIEHVEVTNTQPAGGEAVLRGIYVGASSDKTLWHHIVIRNCSVHDVNSVGYGNQSYSKMSGGILFNLNIEDAVVEGCTVHNVAVEGIRNNSPLTSSRILIRNNAVDTVYGDGIVIHGSSGGSVIEYNRVNKVCTSDAANYAAVWTYASRHTIVQHNEVWGLTGGGPNDGEAFDADIDTDGDVFQYNYAHDNGRGFMLFMASAKNIVVRYNLGRNDALESARKGGHRLFYQDGAKGSLSNMIYNNTFVEGPIDTIFYKGNEITFLNNILVSRGSIARFSTEPIAAPSSMQKNLFFSSKKDAEITLSALKEGNLFSDPRFKGGWIGSALPSIGANGFFTGPKEFELKPSSPARHAGKHLAGSGDRDYLGRDLPGTAAPSIGALE